MTLEEFCATPGQRAVWVRERDGKTLVYLRRANIVLAGRARRCLEIADVTCSPQRRGHFTDFLGRAEALGAAHGFEVICVSTIVNQPLGWFLGRLGYEAERSAVGLTRWARLPREEDARLRA